MIEIQGEKVFAGGDGPNGEYVFSLFGAGEGGEEFEIAIPSMLFADLAPGVVDATLSSPEAALAAIDKIDVAIDDITRQRDIIAEQHTLVHQLMAAEMPSDVSVKQVADSRHGSDEFPRLDDFQMNEAIAQTGVDQALTDEMRDQVRYAVQQTELPKFTELEDSFRASGLVRELADYETRKETGLRIERTVYETPADRLEAPGVSTLIEPSGYLDELIRADNMLQVADISLEQIDLNLDYMRGLAEESSTDSSRYRSALNEMFRIAKGGTARGREVDTLAVTLEVHGERILAGGDGPNGEYMIRLSEGDVEGAGHEIAIPSMLFKDLSPGLFYANIETREAAIAAVDYIEFASKDIARTREMIAEQRTLIHQLISAELPDDASLTQFGNSFHRLYPADLSSPVS